MQPNWLDDAATVSRLRELAAQQYLSQHALDRALAIAGHRPTAQAWYSFLRMCLLVLGAALAVSGVFFFFAYNWQDIPRLVKLGLLECAVGTSAVLALIRGRERLSGKICLLVAALLVGALLAVYGQAYQTGADAYQLFLAWSALIAGWVVISKFTPLWALLWVLLNILLATFIGYQNPGQQSAFQIQFVGNAAWLLGWEIAGLVRPPLLFSRWFARIVAVVASICIVLPTAEFIGSFPWSQSGFNIAPLLFVGFILFLGWFYSQVSRDLFMLTIAALNVISIGTVLTARLFDNTSGLIVVAIVVIGQSALAVLALRRVAQRWEKAV